MKAWVAQWQVKDNMGCAFSHIVKIPMGKDKSYSLQAVYDQEVGLYELDLVDVEGKTFQHITLMPDETIKLRDALNILLRDRMVSVD